VLGPDQTTLTYALTFANLQANPTEVHLHVGPAGQNGPVATDANGANIELGNLPAGTSGTVGPQTFTVNAAFGTQLVAGDAYANVHRCAARGGETRGQPAGANGMSPARGGTVMGVSSPGSLAVG